MIRSLICCLVIVGTTLCSGPAIAAQEDIEVTISTEIAPVFQNGELTGCALNFQAGKNDYIYFGGDLALINGSLNLYTPNGKAPFYVLKLGVLRNGEKAYAAPSSAFILSDKASNKADFMTSLDAETPGFRLFTFSAREASVDIMGETIRANKTIRIGYTMNDGSMSAIIPISLSMKKLNFENPAASLLDNDASKKWLECNLNALDAAIARLRAKRSK